MSGAVPKRIYDSTAHASSTANNVMDEQNKMKQNHSIKSIE